MSAYAAWIAAYLTRNDNFVRGRCSRATAEMIEAFPELRRACGFAHVSWGRDQHWWCVAPDGSIVDPTVNQFGQLGVLQYEELDPNDTATRARVPSGTCMDCGGDVYNGATFCSSECESNMTKYLDHEAIQ